jgi:glyoxylase-like metal-dependent hydrolase (beta-lactamase superfamily II)
MLRQMSLYNIQHFFDPETSTLSYIVYDEASKDALIVDSVLGFNQASGEYDQKSANELLSFVSERGLILHYILETHAHADHLSGAQYLKEKFPSAQVAIGSGITAVQAIFKDVFHLELTANGEQFDKLFIDEEIVNAGTIQFKVIYTPGHTPACVSYLFKDQEKSFVFTGDALFMPDYGTGRCDFPAGSAENLYDSIQKLYSLSSETFVYTGHDYQPGGRKLKFQTTIEESKSDNIRLKSSTSKEEFVSFRKERDATLSTPKLLLPSIQVNIDAGRLPIAEGNGVSYLKLPLNKKG